MEATGGDSEAVAPSKALLEVRQCIAELAVARAKEAPAQPTHAAPQSLDAVAVGDLSGFVPALQNWHDDHDFAPLEYFSQVANLKPRFEFGDATLDVLQEFYEMRGTIRDLWRGDAPAGTGALLPLLFQFFGFYRVDFVTSEKQLYQRARKLKNQLEQLSPGDREIRLHSVCFERAPVKRRTTTSTTSSDDSKQRDDLEILRRERRWLERERENVSTRQVLFEEAKLRSIEALRAEGEEQSEARSRVNEIEAQLRETQISLEETERQRPRGAADRLVVFRNDQGD
jgi:hypothetical protein